ncbi:MAG TPA: hypothetical protein VF548_00270 [Allosphingosinicella sp.]
MRASVQSFRDTARARLDPVVAALRRVSVEKIRLLLKSWWERLRRTRFFKMFTIGRAVAGVGWAILLGFLALDPGIPYLCSSEWPRKNICRPIGLGGVLTPSEEQRLARARSQGCPAIAALLRSEPADTSLSKAAQQIWNTRSRDVVREKVDSVTMGISVGVDGQASRAGAERGIAQAARTDAAERCGMLIRDSRQKLLDSVARLEPSRCQSFSSGWMCTAEGRAECRIARRTLFPEERC